MELELDLLGTATGLRERCCKEKGCLRKVFSRVRFERQNFSCAAVPATVGFGTVCNPGLR